MSDGSDVVVSASHGAPAPVTREPNRPGRGGAFIGWRIRFWLHHQGLLDAFRLPDPGPKTARALQRAIAANAPAALPKGPPRPGRPRGRPRKAHMEIEQDVR